MSRLRIFVLTIGLATCFGLLSEPLYAQRGNILEGIGRTLLDEAINGGRRQPPGNSTPPKPQYQQQQAPGESGRTPVSNPYGGTWGNIIQPQPRPQPRPGVNPQPRIQPRTYPPINSRSFDTYYYPPSKQSGNYPNLPSNQQLYPNQSTYPNQPSTTYYPQQQASTGPIKITFPKTQQGTCSFSIISGSSEHPRTMNPGQMQRLEGSSVWKIRLKENGVGKTYRLTPGSDYVFVRNSGNALELLMQVKPVAVEESAASQN